MCLSAEHFRYLARRWWWPCWVDWRAVLRGKIHNHTPTHSLKWEREGFHWLGKLQGQSQEETRPWVQSWESSYSSTVARNCLCWERRAGLQCQKHREGIIRQGSVLWWIHIVMMICVEICREISGKHWAPRSPMWEMSVEKRLTTKLQGRSWEGLLGANEKKWRRDVGSDH